MAEKAKSGKDVKGGILASTVPLATVIAEEGGQVTRFMDITWDLSPLIGDPSLPRSNAKVRFDCQVTSRRKASGIPSQTLVRSLQEFAYARLIAPPPGSKRCSPRTLIVEIGQLTLLTRWLLRRGVEHFPELTVEQLNEFRDHLMANRTWEVGDRGGTRGVLQIALILRAVQRLWEYKNAMSEAISFYPWNGINPRDVIGYKRERGEENRTPVIPKEILDPMIRHAFRYVEILSNDIIQLRSDLESVRADRLAAGYSKVSVDRDVGDYIFRKLRRRVRLTLDPMTGAPWRATWALYSEFRNEERVLIAACFIVIAYLTGMRVAEILSIRENAISDRKAIDGRRLIEIHSRLFKGVPNPEGRAETWVIVPMVVKAVERIEVMTAYQRSRPGDVIFRNTFGGSLKKGTVNEYINLFRDHVSDVFPFDPVPTGEEGPWKFNTKQFRRTLAHHIARQPFGVIAGMLQYKHVHVATFEGYAGVENLADWKALLAQERVLANADFLEDIAHDVVEGNVTGPKGEQMLREFRGVAGDRRGDDVGYYLRHKAKNLYPGILNYCFFESETAMCLSDVHGLRDTPVMSFCHPDRCPNSCISKKHKPIWEAAIIDVEALRRTSKLSVPQRVALEQEAKRMKRAIAHLSEDRDGAQSKAGSSAAAGIFGKER